MPTRPRRSQHLCQRGFLLGRLQNEFLPRRGCTPCTPTTLRRATWGSSNQGRSIPLYVGEAETSLVARDLHTHFGVGGSGRSTTGQSTLLRSFAALLHERLDLTPVPRESAPPHRFVVFTLDAPSEARLTEWMHEHLRLAVWFYRADAEVPLVDVESAVIRAWAPPLSLKGSPAPSVALKPAQALMALRARESVQSGKMKS
jgi:hypothetical protein